jgi:AraC-like DNA-binding protein
VRISYPAALVELALVLCATVGKRQAASVIGVGVSTVYRWVEMHRTSWMPRGSLRTDGPATFTADVISELSKRCEHAGIRVNAPASNSATTSETVRSADSDQERASPPNTSIGVVRAIATEPMSRAKQEIETQYARRLSCEQLAAIANMPRIRFIREFSSTFGVPPYRYLLGIRVQRATELLQYSSEPLPVVAAMAGFGSASSMQRAFKHFAGGSPGMVVKAIAPRRHSAAQISADSSISHAEKH